MTRCTVLRHLPLVQTSYKSPMFTTKAFRCGVTAAHCPDLRSTWSPPASRAPTSLSSWPAKKSNFAALLAYG